MDFINKEPNLPLLVKNLTNKKEKETQEPFLFVLYSKFYLHCNKDKIKIKRSKINDRENT